MPLRKITPKICPHLNSLSYPYVVVQPQNPLQTLTTQVTTKKRMAFLGATITTFTPLLRLLLILLTLPLSTLAQFQFFEQMFNNPSQAQQHAQHSPQQQNVASDSSWYRRNYDGGEPYYPFPLLHPLTFLVFACLLTIFLLGGPNGENV